MAIEANGSSIDVTPQLVHIKGPSGEIKVGKGIKAGDELTADLAEQIATESKGQFRVENGFLVGPDGFKIKIGEKLKEPDIQALTKHVPDMVNGKTEVKATGGNGEPPAVPAEQPAAPPQ